MRYAIPAPSTAPIHAPAPAAIRESIVPRTLTNVNKDHHANMTASASTRLDRSRATVRRALPGRVARPTSTNANPIRVRTTDPVWTILERFAASACQVLLGPSVR